MLHQNITPGVHWIQDPYVNWYMVADGNDLTIVDCGLPKSWDTLQSALTELGRSPADVKAIVLTHGHFDHIGFAEQARKEWNIPVWVPEKDIPLTKHPLKYDHERSQLMYAWRPACMKVLGTFIAWGMLGVEPIAEVKTYQDGDTLNVPGSPTAVFTPGHTYGHTSLHLPHRDTLIAGDVIVETDPYTQLPGPRIVARAATANVQQNRESLNRLAEIEAKTTLTGHGKPIIGSLRDSAKQAQATPVA